MASAFNESSFEESTRGRLESFADDIAVVGTFLDARLKGKRVFVDHPETREALAGRIMDGEYRKQDESKAITDHNFFSTQKKYTDKLMGGLVDPLRISDERMHQAAMRKYEKMLSVHESVKALFQDLASYTDVDFDTTRDPGYRGGSTARAKMLHLAAHELWKQSVICHLKFSIYAHQLFDPAMPNFLASELNGFSAYRSIMIPTISTGRSHELDANLSFSRSGSTHNPLVRFVYDTGATNTTVPWSLIGELGVQPDSLTWNIDCMTASGPTRGAKLKIHYLQLHSHVVFRDMEVTVINGGSSALLGMDIISQLLAVRTRDDEKTLLAKENNWVDL